MTAETYSRGKGASTQAMTDEFTAAQFAESIITSHSIDGTFESCPRRFEFLHMYMRAPEKESDAYAADVGTAIHEATQEWQRQLFRGTSHYEAERLGEIELLKFWPWQVEDNRKANSLPVGQRTLGNALLLLNLIYESPIWVEWELVSIEGFGPAIEVPWRIVHRSLGLIPMPYNKSGYFCTQGKIDFILRHKKTGKYRVVDLKTTEKNLPAHNAAFRFSGQAGQYGMVLDHALGLDWEHNGLDVTYVIIHFADELTVYPIDYHLDLDEVRDAIDVKLERLNRMKNYALSGHWSRRAHGCEFFGVPCGFLDICQRRDRDFVERWFEFEIASGRFKEYKRVYDPIWVLEA